MKIWTIMPVKPLVRAKSRLAGVLTPDQRKDLAMQMLIHNIRSCESMSPAVTDTLVISRDMEVLSKVRDLWCQNCSRKRTA